MKPPGEVAKHIVNNKVLMRNQDRLMRQVVLHEDDQYKEKEE
jgi:hypothetical protein